MNVDTRLSRKISVVLIERNRASELATNLERLHSLYEPVPIIVVDNGSEDETVPLIRATYPHVELLQLFGNYGSAGSIDSNEWGRRELSKAEEERKAWFPEKPREPCPGA